MIGTTLPRIWKRAIHPIITAKVEPLVAQHTADLAAARGRLVFVCYQCWTPEQREKLEGRENLSHGICEPCLIVQMRNMGMELRQRRGAA